MTWPFICLIDVDMLALGDFWSCPSDCDHSPGSIINQKLLDVLMLGLVYVIKYTNVVVFKCAEYMPSFYCVRAGLCLDFVILGSVMCEWAIVVCRQCSMKILLSIYSRFFVFNYFSPWKFKQKKENSLCFEILTVNECQLQVVLNSPRFFLLIYFN